MFQGLSQQLQTVFASLKPGRTFTEDNLSAAVKEVRLALLEADVNYGVVKRLVQQIKERTLGTKLLKSVAPRDQFIKIVHDEIKRLVGEGEAQIKLAGMPSVILLCGLQGSGKTTHAAKLARYYQDKMDRKPLLVACDLQRVAAIDQLQTLGKQAGVEVFADPQANSPLVLVKQALEFAKRRGFDLLILDTAGRLHLDQPLMEELSAMKKIANPSETLFVASAAIGQDAVTTALAFENAIGLTGVIMTMLDGRARAGGALGMLAVTGRMIKFEGVGEKLADLQLFDAASFADRVLGRGDVINLVKRAQDRLGEQELRSLEQKVSKSTFSFDDFLKQIRMIGRLGSLKTLMKMLPGAEALGNLDLSEQKLKQITAIILSMTPRERAGLDDLEILRRHRIAKGSGVGLEEVNRMLKLFKQIKRMMKQVPLFKKRFAKEGELNDQLQDLMKGGKGMGAKLRF